MKDEAEFGPAMAALNDRQRAFVLAMLEHPGCTLAQAAKIAGYRNSEVGLRVHGHYCAHHPGVQAAMREETGKRLNSLSVLAANVMMDVMLDAGTSMKDKMKAAGMVLDRVGFGAQQNINVHQTFTDQSGAALMSRIRALAEKHGLEPGRLLGAPEPVEAEFSEVEK